MLSTLARRVALAAVPFMMLAAAPGTAVATPPSATIQFNNQARLQPDGSVIVTFTYSCFPPVGGGGSFFVQVSQPTALGQAFGPAMCDTQKHKAILDVPFTPDSFPGGPFTLGSAAVIGEVFGATAQAAQVILHVN